MADRIDGKGTRQDSRPSSRASATSDHGIDHRRQVGTPRDEGKLEMFEGKLCEVKNPSRQLRKAHDEIERLQAAKRRALAIADERAKEANALRRALRKIAAQRVTLPTGSQYVAEIASRALEQERGR